MFSFAILDPAKGSLTPREQKILNPKQFAEDQKRLAATPPGPTPGSEEHRQMVSARIQSVLDTPKPTFGLSLPTSQLPTSSTPTSKAAAGSPVMDALREASRERPEGACPTCGR